MKNRNRLYDLLPAVYRQRDAEQGYALRALLQVMAEQVDVVESDISQLYDTGSSRPRRLGRPHRDLIGFGRFTKPVNRAIRVANGAEQELIPRRNWLIPFVTAGAKAP
jgi:hypothetical protein